MAEEQTNAGSEDTAASNDAPQSLDDVYKEYGIEDQAAQFQQARQQPQQQVQQSQPAPQQAPIAIPDPTLDPEGYRRYESQRLSDAQALRQSLTHVSQQLSQMQVSALREREEADIKAARSVLAEKVPGVDPEVLEAHLGLKAQKDQRLMQIWQQRAQKPEAWQKALNAVGNELASKYSVKTDPQLTENTRAMRAATQAASTSRANDTGEKKFSDDPRQFEKEWSQYLSSNTY